MAEPVAIDRLADALGCGPSEHIALVGGGGKTTSLFALARTLPGTTIATTTTRMASHQTGDLRLVVDPHDATIEDTASPSTPLLVWAERGPTKALGVRPERCDRWYASAGIDHVIVEADGARQRPFTAPHVFEPVLPATVTLLVACIGADALGRVIADQCHRPMRIAAIAGCSPYERLTPDRAATVLLSDRGGRKGQPPSARFGVAVHGVHDTNRPFVDDLVDELARRDPITVVTIEPVDAVLGPDGPPLIAPLAERGI